jgi:hypothetical protein
MICLITAEVVSTWVRAGRSGSSGSYEPLFHMPHCDSGSSDGSRSSDGPGIPSSAKAVNVNGSSTSPGAVRNVASAVVPTSPPDA